MKWWHKKRRSDLEEQDPTIGEIVVEQRDVLLSEAHGWAVVAIQLATNQSNLCDGPKTDRDEVINGVRKVISDTCNELERTNRTINLRRVRDALERELSDINFKNANDSTENPT